MLYVTYVRRGPRTAMGNRGICKPEMVDNLPGSGSISPSNLQIITNRENPSKFSHESPRAPFSIFQGISETIIIIHYISFILAFVFSCRQYPSLVTDGSNRTRSDSRGVFRSSRVAAASVVRTVSLGYKLLGDLEHFGVGKRSSFDVLSSPLLDWLD